MQILGFPDSLDQAKALAEALGVPHAEVTVHRFPDGESRLALPERLPEDVTFFRTLDHPNAKLVEVLLAAAAAREAGAERITLVAPYLCYMRQDKAFHPGEVVSQRIVGRFLAGLADRVVTVDPHLHRVATLAEAVPAAEAVSLTAARPMGEFLARRAERPLLLGPDQESAQWVKAVAEVGGLDFAVARKERIGDLSVRVGLPERSYRGRTVVIVDDMASTGRTLAAATQALHQHDVAAVKVLVTHPLFVGDAEAHLRASGVSEIWSTDSIAHPTNAIPLAGLIADALRPPLSSD